MDSKKKLKAATKIEDGIAGQMRQVQALKEKIGKRLSKGIISGAYNDPDVNRKAEEEIQKRSKVIADRIRRGEYPDMERDYGNGDQSMLSQFEGDVMVCMWGKMMGILTLRTSV